MFRLLRTLPCLFLLAALPGLAMAGDRARGRAPVPAPPSQQQQPPPPPPQRDPPRDTQNDPSALPDSVRRVERTTGGEVLRAEPMQRDGREVYRIKVLTADGRVRVMQEDPRERPPEQHGRDRKGKNRDKDRDASADGQDADQAPPQE